MVIGHSQKHGLGRGDTREITIGSCAIFGRRFQVMMLDPRALVHVALTAQFGYPGCVSACFG